MKYNKDKVKVLNGFTPMWEQAPPAGLCEFQLDLYDKDGNWGMTWGQLVDVGTDGTFRNVSWDEGRERWVPRDTADFACDSAVGTKYGEPVAWKRHDDRADAPRRKTPEQKAREKLDDIAAWLGDNPIQSGTVARYDEDTAVSVWEHGAIVCTGGQLKFIGEDSGVWYVLEDEYGEYGYQEGLSVSWAPSFAKAVSDLYEHVISGRQKTDNTVI